MPRHGGKRARLGAHMSIAGGFVRAIERARSVDATALQIFVKSARQWRAPRIDPAEAEGFRGALDAAGLARFTLAHASYLINLASPEKAARERSARALGEELDRCRTLGVPYLVVHPGSHVGSGEEAGLDRVAEALSGLLAGRDTTVTLLLENTAGQGTNLGHRFEHLGRLIRSLPSAAPIGVCFDTCHAFAAGHDFRDAASYRATFDALEREVGLARLKAFHLNDSKGELGSGLDRHEHIGAGAVGLEGFRRILEDRRFAELPMVLETPKNEDLADDRRNLATLRGLIGR